MKPETVCSQCLVRICIKRTVGNMVYVDWKYVPTLRVLKEKEVGFDSAHWIIAGEDGVCQKCEAHEEACA